MIECRHVTKKYRNKAETVIALNDINISVGRGELTVLVGESGCGKSTLARILSGIIKPDEGEVLLEGRSIIPPARRKDRSLCAQIQMVLQDGKSALDPRYTIYRSIAEPIRNLMAVSRNAEQEMVRDLMEKVGLDPELARRLPSELSGGQQKRVCIARAVATSPEYLIFDEAVSGLDVLLKEKILNLIRKIHYESGAATLMITHDMDIALYMADRILVMKEGQIVEDCARKEGGFCFDHPYSRLLVEQMKPFA